MKNFFIVCVHVCIHMYARRDQRLTLGVFLDCPPSYMLRGDLSLNPELADSASLASLFLDAFIWTASEIWKDKQSAQLWGSELGLGIQTPRLTLYSRFFTHPNPPQPHLEELSSAVVYIFQK